MNQQRRKLVGPIRVLWRDDSMVHTLQQSLNNTLKGLKDKYDNQYSMQYDR